MTTQKNTLIWDLGNTLLTADTFCFATEVGLTDFILYPLLDWKNPKKVYELAFDLMASIDSPYHSGHTQATGAGKILPPLMLHWLTGTISSHEIGEKLNHSLHRWQADGSFSSKRQERLVRHTMKTLFNPEKFARCMKPIKEGIELLKECAEYTDGWGNKLNSLYILSNWDQQSFEYLRHSPRTQTLFSYFDAHHITISGEAGVLKPQPEIYHYFIERYSLNPGRCILIDDQVENIIAAQEQGLKGILLENSNYKRLKTELKKLNVL